MKQQKIKLIDRLNETLKDLYHNARVNYAYDAMESYTDLTGYCAYNKFNEFVSDEINYINEMLGLTKKEVYETSYCKKERPFRLIAQLILKYGQVYSYGRGGKTVAPNKLMNESRNPYPIQYEYDDINASEATDLILMINAFNDYIKNWCSFETQESLFNDTIAYEKEELREELVLIKKVLKSKIKEYKYLKNTSFTQVKDIVKNVIESEINDMNSIKKKLLK